MKVSPNDTLTQSVNPKQQQQRLHKHQTRDTWVSLPKQRSNWWFMYYIWYYCAVRASCRQRTDTMIVLGMNTKRSGFEEAFKRIHTYSYNASAPISHRLRATPTCYCTDRRPASPSATKYSIYKGENAPTSGTPNIRTISNVKTVKQSSSTVLNCIALHWPMGGFGRFRTNWKSCVCVVSATATGATVRGKKNAPALGPLNFIHHIKNPTKLLLRKKQHRTRRTRKKKGNSKNILRSITYG